MGATDLVPPLWPGPGYGNHPRVVDTQHARVFSAEARQEKAAQLAALKARHESELNVAPSNGEPRSKAGTFASPAANFTINTYTPVAGAPGTWGGSWTVESASDQIFFGTQSGSGAQGTNIGINNANGAIASGCSGTTCSGNNFFSLTNIYTPHPKLQWASFVSGGTSASVALSYDGTMVYVLSDDGHLYCLAGTTGATCSGWTTPALSIAAGGALTPWVDSATNAIYVANGNKGLYRINALTGKVQWGGAAFAYTTNAASRAQPVEVNNIVYLGDGGGYLWRIVDPTTGVNDAQNTAAPTATSSAQAVGGSCGSGTVQAIDGSVSIDVTSNLVFLANYGCMFSFNHFTGSGTFAVQASGWTGSVPNQTFRTWPAIDGTYVYWVIADKPTSYTPVSAVWKATYGLGSVSGSNLANASSSQSGAGLNSAPVVWNSLLYVGDQSGYVEEFGCASSKSATTAFCAETSANGGSVNTPIVFDDATGNIEYGFATSGGAGGLGQFPLWETGSASGYTWGCPAGYVACDHQACGAGSNSTACVPSAECSAASSSCQTVASLTSTAIQCASASENGTVTLSCPSGQQIQSILGASYGLPESSPSNNTCSGAVPTNPPTFSLNGACNASDTLDKTYSLCGAMNSAQTCTFTANNANFGDPCVGTGKNFAVWFVCAAHQTSTVAPMCSRINVTPSAGSDPCKAGTCTGTCSSGFGDCNSNLAYDGCETELTSDLGNCGACGNSCPSVVANASGATCVSSACTYTGSCSTGYGDCDGSKANGCETSLNAVTTCGSSCGAATNCAALPHVVAASAACATGVCSFTCQANWGDCDGNPANGCETDLTSTASHCGSCAQSCGSVTSGGSTAPTCSASTCQYLTPGETYSVTIVASHTTPTFVLAGAGGGGSQANAAGSGGGGGGFCDGQVSSALTVGSTLTVTVGSGGASGNPGVAGGASSVTSSSAGLVASAGGGGAGRNTLPAGGAGGTGSVGAGGAGLTCWSGGAGGASNGGKGHGGGGGAASFGSAGGAGGAGGSGCTSTTAGGAGGGGGGGGGGGNGNGTYYGNSGGGTGLTNLSSSGAGGSVYCTSSNPSGAGSQGGGANGGGGGSAGGQGTTPAAGGSYGGGGGTGTSGGNGGIAIQF